MSTCPPREQLTALLDNRLAGAAADDLAGHVQTCTACQEYLERLTDDERFAGRAAPGPSAPHAKTFLARVKQLSPPAAPASEGDLPDLPGYEVLKVLARGGMGVVYQARQRALGRLVALKMIRDARYASPEALIRFRIEGEMLARLRHPNIVQIHDVGAHDGQPYLALEYVDGGSLEDRLDDRPFSPRDAAELVETLARAVDAAHAQGIIHRDLKPANVLLQAPASPAAGLGTLKIGDFGLAKPVHDSAGLTETGCVMGSPPYMAPEQAQGRTRDIGPPTDVHALGVILYRLLTGRRPFNGEDVMEVLSQVVHADPLPPSRLVPRLPRDLESICLKCLHKPAEQRYGTAGALADDLRRFLAGEPVRARRIRGPERAWRWGRRHPAWAALVVVSGVALLALGGVGVGLHFNVRLQRALAEAEQANQRAELFQSFHRVGMAHAGWRDGDLSRTEALLDECPAGHRHWEWHYLKRLCHADLLTFRGHTGEVRAVAFSPDGGRLASTGNDGTLKVWDAATGRVVLDLPAHAAPAECLAFSPDGARLASAGADQTVKLWDAATGRLARAWTAHEYLIQGLAFSPDGRRLASTSKDQTAKVWDAATGQLLREFKGHRHFVAGVAFSPDGTRVASAGEDRVVHVWEAATGRQVHVLTHSEQVLGVAFSPDGAWLASGGADRAVHVWEAATGRRVLTFATQPGWVQGVAYSPDGARLASVGRDQSIRIWDAATGREVRRLKGHTSWVQQVAFSPDGTRLASASLDGTVKVWDAARDPEALTLTSYRGRASSVAFSPDGGRLATADTEGAVQICDVITGRAVVTLQGHRRDVWHVAFHPDGSRLASASLDGSVKVWDAATGRVVLDFTGHAQGVRAVAFSPDGARLASGGYDRTVKVWDAATGRVELDLAGHTTWVECVAFSPDGARLASSGREGAVRVWDARTGRLLFTVAAHEGGTRTVAFSPDGSRLVSAGHDGPIHLWDAATGRQLASLRGHPDVVFRVAFSPDGARLASVGTDGVIKFWDPATGHQVLTLYGHASEVYDLAFSCDGSRLASACRDGTVKVWDARPWSSEAPGNRVVPRRERPSRTAPGGACRRPPGPVRHPATRRDQPG